MGKVLMAGIVPLLTAPTTGSSPDVPDPDVPDPDVPSETLPLSSFPEGQIVMINENGSPIPFYLSKHDYESGLNGTGRSLLVRKNAYDSRAWNTTGNLTYNGSLIDTWLNSTYKNLLDSEVRNLLSTTKFYYTIGNENETVSSLQRSVFILSATELGLTSRYANTEGSTLPISSTLRIVTYNGAAVAQWTRSPDTSWGNDACAVNENGEITYVSINANRYSRPCFTLPSATLVDPEPNADGSINLLL